jgi:hypothetical protein
MTRSRKKTPCCHVAGHDGWWKRIFNRRVRRNPIDFDEGASAVQDGMAYRRMNESWFISDLKCVHATVEDYYYPGEDEDEARNCYEHDYIRK